MSCVCYSFSLNAFHVSASSPGLGITSIAAHAIALADRVATWPSRDAEACANSALCPATFGSATVTRELAWGTSWLTSPRSVDPFACDCSRDIGKPARLYSSTGRDPRSSAQGTHPFASLACAVIPATRRNESIRITPVEAILQSTIRYLAPHKVALSQDCGTDFHYRLRQMQLQTAGGPSSRPRRFGISAKHAAIDEAREGATQNDTLATINEW